jgi:hypothetical protein
MRAFYQIEKYSASQPEYHLLPFRFLMVDDSTEVFVNEVGEFVLAPNGTARTLIQRQLPRASDLYATFKAKQFIADDSSSPLLDLLATKYRTKYSFIEGFTKLHIFVVTLRCDHSCHYCQLRGNRSNASHLPSNTGHRHSCRLASNWTVTAS